MALSEEVALILKAQNVSSPVIADVVASLKSLRTELGTTTGAVDTYNASLARSIDLQKRFITSINDARLGANTTRQSFLDMAAADAAAVSASRMGASVRAAATPAPGSTSDASGSRGGLLGGGLGQTAAIIGGYAVYSGIKGGVNQALQFNATAASTQATTHVSTVWRQAYAQSIQPSMPTLPTFEH
jgi:hypothetical protein